MNRFGNFVKTFFKKYKKFACTFHHRQISVGSAILFDKFLEASKLVGKRRVQKLRFRRKHFAERVPVRILFVGVMFVQPFYTAVYFLYHQFTDIHYLITPFICIFTFGHKNIFTERGQNMCVNFCIIIAFIFNLRGTQYRKNFFSQL